MKYAKRISLIVVLQILGCYFAFSQKKSSIVLPSYLGSHMVLQQKAKITFHGVARPLQQISLKLSWNGKSLQTQSDGKGQWEIAFNTPRAGGPYSLTLSDGEPLVLTDVLIGEVWLCSGQSNMEMPVRGFDMQPISGSEEILAQSAIPGIRLFKIDRKSSLSPEKNLSGKWEQANSKTVAEFSAVALLFGKQLHEKLNVPVGLILASVGGTRIQSWMSAKSLKDFKNEPIPETLAGSKEPHKENTALYNAMIAPLRQVRIKGVIWFQGESNRHEAPKYERLFPALVKDWRKEWGLGNFPFYYVQIAPFASQDPSRDGPGLRQAQLNSLAKIPFSGMVSTMDIGSEKLIHFPNKTTVAQRLALLALNKTYHFAVPCFSPMLSRVNYSQNRATLRFKNVYAGLQSPNGELRYFEMAGTDQQFYPAKAEIKGKNKIILTAETMMQPHSVRYAYRDWLIGDLFNSAGLPAPSFTAN